MVKAPVIFIVGPTGTGKTELSLRLSDAYRTWGLDVEIVNADSRQVYKGMSIGTAKPTQDQLMHTPHHIIDVVEPSQPFNLAIFLDLARSVIANIQARQRLPIVVGGTGQYIWALVEGWMIPPATDDLTIRMQLEKEAKSKGTYTLFERLKLIDPPSAASINPRNTRRVVRALEVSEATGIPFSRHRRRVAPGFEPKMFAPKLPRAKIYERVDRRIDAMLIQGWEREIRNLKLQGYGPTDPAFSSVGYREISNYIDGKISREDAINQAKYATHKLVRSQSAWFRPSDDRIDWRATNDELIDEAIAYMST